MTAPQQSKAVLYGEPVSAFLSRGRGSTGSWVCKSRKDAVQLQNAVNRGRHSLAKKGIDLPCKCRTMPFIFEEEKGEIAYIVVCKIEPKEASHNI